MESQAISLLHPPDKSCSEGSYCRPKAIAILAKNQPSTAKAILFPAWSDRRAPWTSTPSSNPKVSTTDMTLATKNLFTTIKPDFSSVSSGLNRLSIGSSSTGLYFAPSPNSDFSSEEVVYSLPRAISFLMTEVIINCLPFRQVVRQQPPWSSYLHQIEYSVANLWHILATGTSSSFRFWNQRFDFMPFCIAFVGIVGLSVHLRSSTLHQL